MPLAVDPCIEDKIGEYMKAEKATFMPVTMRIGGIFVVLQD
jgi:hypothetical protein